jgi:hypothetical protein
MKYTLSPSRQYSDHDIEEILGDSGTLEVHALYNKENASWSTFHEAKLKKLNSIQSVLDYSKHTPEVLLRFQGQALQNITASTKQACLVDRNNGHRALRQAISDFALSSQ